MTSQITMPPNKPPRTCDFRRVVMSGLELSAIHIKPCYTDWGAPDQIANCWANIMAERLYNCEDFCTPKRGGNAASCSSCGVPYIWRNFECTGKVLGLSRSCQTCRSKAYTYYLDNCAPLCDGIFQVWRYGKVNPNSTFEEPCKKCGDTFWSMEE